MSVDDSVYAAPESSLSRPVEGTARSLDDAMAGNWDFDIGDVLSEAWRVLAGSKGVIWIGLLIGGGANIALQMIGSGFQVAMEDSPGAAISISLVLNMVGQFIQTVATAGVYLYAIKRVAGDERAGLEDVTSAFSIALPLIGLSLLSGLITGLGFLLLILPGIYLAVAYGMAVPLKIERGLDVWEAMETSRKTIQNQWFKVFGLNIVVFLAIIFGAMFTLGIGLIWLSPFAFLTSAVLYNRIFGYSGTDATAG